MKLVTRILLCAVFYIALFRYINCSVNSTSKFLKSFGSAELDDVRSQLCENLSFEKWDSVLLEKNEYYRDVIHPAVAKQYTENVVPKYLEIKKCTLNLYEEQLAPYVKCACLKVQDFVHQHEQLDNLRVNAIKYNGEIKELSLVGKAKFQKTMQDLKLKINSMIKVLVGNASGVQELVGEKMRSILSSINGPEIEKLDPQFSIEDKKQIYNESRGDVDVVFEPENEWESVQKEFESWYYVVNNKTHTVSKFLDDEVEEYIEEQLKTIKPRLTKMVKEFDELTKTNFEKLLLKMEDIDCTEEIDPKTGNKRFVSKNGENIVTERVTKEFMDSMFANVQDEITNTESDIKQTIGTIFEELQKNLESIQTQNVDLFEEWGNIMISEWSRTMAYIDIAAANQPDTETSSHEFWKTFVQLKKKVVSTRDELVTHKLKTGHIEKFLMALQSKLNKISKGSSEYLLVLRSKNNKLLQERENRENADEHV